MSETRRPAIGAAFAAAALAALAAAFGVPWARGTDDEPHYQTNCSVVEPDAAEGYVSNASPDLYRVSGVVRFKFLEANSMSRPVLQAQADSLIPAGETVRVARVQLTSRLRPGEACLFDVTDAIRKQ
ncbi:MAG: hypothetical protein ACHQ49_07605 [Elusimicrobiota bacterium]